MTTKRRSYMQPSEGKTLAVWCWALMLLGVLVIGGGVLGAFMVSDWAVVPVAVGFIVGLPCLLVGVLAGVLSRASHAIHHTGFYGPLIK